MTGQHPATSAGPAHYYGKYRGTVIKNIDPEQIGRVLVQVPDVLGMNHSTWSMPCVPAAGIQAGIFVVPPDRFEGVGWNERGDPDYPDLDRRLWGIG